MTRKPILGIVCGMQTEFDALGALAIDPRVRVAVSGARPDLAEDGARWLIDEGCTKLLSFGVAGGLAPDLQPGDVLGGELVVTEAGEGFDLSPLDHGAEQVAGALLGLDRMVFTAEEKRGLHQATGAVAVDMETHRVARIGAEHKVPVHALRAVGDGATRTLPAFVANALSVTGHPLIFPVLKGLLRDPMALPELLRLKRDTDRALRRLAGIVEDGLLERLIDA
ncbi:adenosylhopane nucleosidase [Rhodobacteraceae bacterium NNCM2]|nr:adenosylhopane nucleosidase [Coraliihabitans acroporae]